MEATETFRFEGGLLITQSAGYAISKAQARAILKKVRGKRTYTQDYSSRHLQEDYSDDSTYPVRKNADGSIEVGCMTFSKADVTVVRKWLRSGAKGR